MHAEFVAAFVGHLKLSNQAFTMNRFPGRLCTAVASNRPTEALASVISSTFVVNSHYKHS